MLKPLRLAWFGIKERLFLRRHPDRAARFGAIYLKRMWQNPESASGFGSTVEATVPTRSGLERLIAEHGVHSMLDAPCGDFNWQRLLDFPGHYTGLDIVPELVADNQVRHGGPNRQFARADIVTDELPPADLVLCRECLNHLPLADGQKALEHLIPAARKLLVLTHYPDHLENQDQPASFRYRRLNFTLAPFHLRAPDALIDETMVQPGKYLAVWDVTRGPVRHG